VNKIRIRIEEALGLDKNTLHRAVSLRYYGFFCFQTGV